MPCVYAPSTESVDSEYKSSLQLFMRIIDAMSVEKAICSQASLGKNSIEMEPILTNNKEVDLASATETNV